MGGPKRSRAMQTNLVTISVGLVPHVKGLGQGWLVVLLLVLVMMLAMGVVVLALLRVLMRRHGQSGVGCKVPSIAQVVVVEAIRGRCVRLVDHAIWMLLLLLLLWLWRLLRVLRMKVAQVIVIAVVSRVAAIASVDIIIASVVVVVVILIIAEVDGRDMVLMGMRMVVDLLLLIVIMMRWELLLLLRLLLMVEIAVAVIVKMLGHLKMQLMIHATVNRARNWGHVLLRLDFQWTEQR